MNRLMKLYELIEPITNLIEKNKEEIDLLVSGIEDDINTSTEDWEVIDELESALINLSLSCGDTAMKDLKEIIEPRYMDKVIELHKVIEPLHDMRDKKKNERSE